jgi:hypothetical protein
MRPDKTFFLALYVAKFLQENFSNPRKLSWVWTKNGKKASETRQAKGKLFGFENRSKSSQIIDDNFYTPF